MKINGNIVRLFQYLQVENIRATNECVKDVQNLVKNDITKFARNFYDDFTRRIFGKYNRFEQLKLNQNQKQKEKINGRALWRYEYRNNMNFRCIFIIQRENNTDNPILLCAFTEDGDKKKGKNSYNVNIERAIELIKKYGL